MARTIPSGFIPIDANQTGTTREIDDTEKTIAQNIHFLYSEYRPMVVNTTFRTDQDVASGQQPYVLGSNTASVDAAWLVEPPGAPFLQWEVVALVENTSTTNAATLRFDLASDPHPGTSVDVSVPASSSQWTQVSDRLDIDNTQTTDTIRMYAIKPTGGDLRVHHVMILPKAISSIAGAPNTVNGYTFIPTDDAEVEQDAPLSTRLRRREFGNLYHIYKNRPGACVGWSEDMDYRVGSQAFTTTDDDWVEVVRITVFVPRGTEFIRWGLFGRKTGSGTGKVRLRTASMDNNEDTPIEVDVVNSWSSPYTSNLVKYDDVGAGKLNVYPGSKELTQDALIVDIKSDGSARVDLAGLTAWFEVVT